MFVDASAIVAILTREADADELANALDVARSPITSPVAVFEATLGVRRKRHASVAKAQEDVSEFLGATRRSSIWETASPTRSRKPIERHCCSKARTSTKPTSVQQRKRASCNPPRGASERKS